MTPITMAMAEGGFKNDFLTFECVSQEGGSIGFNKAPEVSGTLYYRKPTTDWIEYSEPIELAYGEKIQMKGTFTFGITSDHNSPSKFLMTGKISVSGNIMTLISGDKPGVEIPGDYCFFKLFEDCTSLTTAPELPATTLAQYCYYGMFSGCTSLTTAPELPATTLSQQCYCQMFSGCTSLTTAPELPATELESDCYDSMFSGCTSLTTAPELPAATLVGYCYYNMFMNCSNLGHVRCYAFNISAYMATMNWLSGVSSTGTFVKSSSANWGSGSDGIPTGWTVENL